MYDEKCKPISTSPDNRLLFLSKLVFTYKLHGLEDASKDISHDAFLKPDDFLRILNSIRKDKVLEHDYILLDKDFGTTLPSPTFPFQQGVFLRYFCYRHHNLILLTPFPLIE